MLHDALFAAALTLLCLGVVFNDLVTHHLHRLRKRNYDERCTICRGPTDRLSDSPTLRQSDSPTDRPSDVPARPKNQSPPKTAAMNIEPANRAKVCTEAALHGKSTDPHDWIARHRLAARAYEEAVQMRPNDPKAARAKAIAQKHLAVAQLIEDYSHAPPSRAPIVQQRILGLQHAIAAELKELKR